MDAQIQRLEAVCSRLEAIARGKKGGAEDVEADPEGYLAYKELCDNEGQAVIKAWETIGHTKAADCAKLMQDSMDRVCVLLRQENKAKKGGNYQEFAGPIQEAHKAARKLTGTRDRKLFDFDSHHKANEELISSFFWAWNYPPSLPASFAKGQLESADFHLNRIRMKQKSEKNEVFVKAMKAFLTKQAETVKEFYKMGVEYCGQGDLSVDGAAAPPAPKKQEAKEEEVKPKKAAPKKEEKKNDGNLFADLNKGLKATSGLKTVKKSQKNKYNREKISGKVTGGPKKAKSKKKLPDPKKTKRGPFTWFYEYYQSGLTEITEDDKLTIKNGLYFATCMNCQFRISPKIKSIEMDNCQRVAIEVNDVVSTISLVNCKNVTIYCMGRLPSIQIDKCESPKIIFTSKCWNHVDGRPSIVYSNVAAGNIEVPESNADDAEMVEHPLIEQFVVDFGETGYGKPKFHPLEHSD